MKQGFAQLALIILTLLLSTSGFAVFFIAKNKPAPTPTTSSAETSAKEDDPTANWKTYTNDSIGFSLNYPTDWKIYSESMPRIEFVSDEGFQFRVCKGCAIIPASKYSNENEYFKLLHGEGFREEVIKDRKVMLLTQREAEGIGATAPHPYVTHGYFFHNGLSYSFDLFTPSSESENPEPLLTQILSTFKFLDQPNEAKFCGGIAGIVCPVDYKCLLDGDYPDASGKCVME